MAVESDSDSTGQSSLSAHTYALWTAFGVSSGIVGTAGHSLVAGITLAVLVGAIYGVLVTVALG